MAVRKAIFRWQLVCQSRSCGPAEGRSSPTARLDFARCTKDASLVSTERVRRTLLPPGPPICYSYIVQDIEDVSIISLENKHLAQVARWPSRHFAANTLLKSSIESGSSSPDSYGWALLHRDEVLAIATITLNKEHVGYLNCIVKPGHKGKGAGTAIVEHALKSPEAKQLVHLHATIEPSNTVARRVLKEQGFTLVGNDSKGYLEYAKHTHY